MNNKKTILMIANSDTAVNGFLSFAERLENREDIGFVMVCHQRVRIDLARAKAGKLANPHFTIVDFDGKERRKSGLPIPQDYRYVKDNICVSLIKSVGNVAGIFRENRAGLKRAKVIINSEKPNIILLYADNRSELEKFFLYLAPKQGIKTVIAPICFSSIDGILANQSNGFRLNKAEKLPLTARIVRRLHPEAEKNYRDERVFHKQPFRELIDRAMGFYVPNPWVQGSLADMVCTAYPKQYEEIVSELGEARTEGRLFLTESVEDGIIIEGYRNRESVRQMLSEKYHLHGEQTVIISFSERAKHWSKESDLYNKGVIVQSVLACWGEVLVSLHPRSDLEENRFLERYAGCHIVEEPLRRIAGAADLIVYGDISSVSRWVEWLRIANVTYPSYSMQTKWSDGAVREFRDSLAAAKENMGKEERLEPDRGIDFTEFILDIL